MTTLKQRPLVLTKNLQPFYKYHDEPTVLVSRAESRASSRETVGVLFFFGLQNKINRSLGTGVLVLSAV